MNDDIPIHYLENFPRAYLYSKMSRYQFFKVLSEEINILANKDSGANGATIPSLGVMDDELLREIIPEMKPEYDIFVSENKVWAKKPERKPICLFEIDPLVSCAFNLINGENNIDHIAQGLANSSSLPSDRAFLITRGLFLTLARVGVCLPINNPILG